MKEATNWVNTNLEGKKKKEYILADWQQKKTPVLVWSSRSAGVSMADTYQPVCNSM